MKSTTRWGRALAIGVLLAAFAAPAALGQDEEAVAPEGEPEIEGLGRIFFEVGAWLAQPAGSDLTVTVRQDLNTGLENALATVPTGTESRLRYRAGYEFRDNLGTIVGSYFGTQTAGTQQELTPSVFQFATTNVFPEFPGVFDDGLADGYSSEYSITTRDVRLTYYRDFERTKRIKARWLVGFRRMSHTRSLDTSYYALAANLPPFLDPISAPNPVLEPGTDRGFTESELSVRGIEAGLEVDLPIWRERVWIETGLSVSAMRGTVSTRFESRTHFYAYPDGDGNLIYVDPSDGTSFNDPVIVSRLRQESADVAVRSTNRSTNSAAIDGFFGFRYRAWGMLELFGGFRSSYFDNVSEELVPTSAVRSDDGRRYAVTSVERSARSITYEGYYLGLSYAF
jgi:hypothetical protein